MKRSLCILCLLSLFYLQLFQTNIFSKEITIRIHCWEGYAKPYVENFKKLVKEKYKIDVNLKITNVSDPNEFWNLARGKKVDLISPAHNIPRSPSWAFVDGKVAIPVDLKNIENYKYLLPVLQYN